MDMRVLLTVFTVVFIAEPGDKTQLAGGLIAEHIGEKTLHYLAGIGFIGIGLWTLLSV